MRRLSGSMRIRYDSWSRWKRACASGTSGHLSGCIVRASSLYLARISASVQSFGRPRTAYGSESLALLPMARSDAGIAGTGAREARDWTPRRRRGCRGGRGIRTPMHRRRRISGASRARAATRFCCNSGRKVSTRDAARHRRQRELRNVVTHTVVRAHWVCGSPSVLQTVACRPRAGTREERLEDSIFAPPCSACDWRHGPRRIAAGPGRGSGHSADTLGPRARRAFRGPLRATAWLSEGQRCRRGPWREPSCRGWPG